MRYRLILIPSLAVLIALGVYGCAAGPMRAAQSPEAPPSAVTGAQAADRLLARDLGDGAGGEKIGDLRRDQAIERKRRRDRDSVPWSDDGQRVSTVLLGIDHIGGADVRRSLLNDKKLPLPGSVSSEALTHRVRYNFSDKPLAASTPFVVRSTLLTHPLLPGHHLAVVAVSADAIARPSADVVLCIDVSGSMGAKDRLRMIRDGLDGLLRRMRADDRIAVVSYAATATTIMPMTTVGDGVAVRSALAQLRSGGSSDAIAGLRTAFALAHTQGRADAPAQVLWFSDGDVRAVEKLPQRVWTYSAGSVGLVAVAIAPEILDRSVLVEAASRTGGDCMAVHDSIEARALIGERIAGLLAPVARDARLQVRFQPQAIAAQTLLGWRTRQVSAQQFTDPNTAGFPVPGGSETVLIYDVVAVPAPAGREANPFLSSGGFAHATAMQVRVRWLPMVGEQHRLLECDVPARATPFAEADSELRFAVAATLFGECLNAPGAFRPWAVYRMAKQAMPSDADPAHLDLLEQMAQAAQLDP